MSDFPARAGDGDFGAPRNDESFSEDDDSFDVLAHLEATAGGPAPADRSPERSSDRSPERFSERSDEGLFEAGEMSDEGEMGDEYSATGSADEAGEEGEAASGTSGEEFECGQAQKLEDLLCLQDAPSPLPSPRASSPPRAMPTPMAVPSSAQALRRSPRLAGVPPPPPPEVAAAAAASARMSAPSAKKAGTSLFGAGGGGGFGEASGVTPYSSRRGRRESQKFTPFTPGSAFGDGGVDDQNASFRTAIMGEPSPNGSLGDPGSVLKGPLFEEPLDAQLSTLESEPPTPESAAAGTPTREGEFSDAVSASPSPPPSGGVGVDVRQGLDVDEGGVTSLGERISGLQLGADEGGQGENEDYDASCGDGEDGIYGGSNGVVSPAAVASPMVAVAACGEEPLSSSALDGSPLGDRHGPQDMSVDPEPTLPDAAATAAAAAAAAAVAAQSAAGEVGAGSWFEPPSPAVASAPADDAGKPTVSPNDGASAEVSPSASRAKRSGGMSTASTFGMSSDDDEEGAAVSFSAAGGASAPSGAFGAGVSEMKLPTLPCVKETLVGEPQRINASVEDVEVDGGRNCDVVGDVDSVVEQEEEEGQDQDGEEVRLQNMEQQREVQQDEEKEESDGVSPYRSSDGSPANAVAGCLRDVAGGTDTGVDCETSVILDEMLLDAAGAGAGLGVGLEARSAGVGKGNGEGKRKAGDMGGAVVTVNGKQKKGAAVGSGVVVSAVEKEAVALAAACVAEMEGKKAPGAARPSIGGAGEEGTGEAEITVGGGAGGGEREGKRSSLPTASFGVTAPGEGGATTRRRQSGAFARRRSSILPGAISPGAARASAAKSAAAARSAKAAAAPSAKVTAAAEAASARVAAAAEAAAARVKSAKAAAAKAAEVKVAATKAAKEKAAASATAAKAAAAAEATASQAAAKKVAAAKAAAAAKTAALAKAAVSAVQPVAADGGGEDGAASAPIAAAAAAINKVAASPTRRGRAPGDSATGVSVSATASVGAGASGSAGGSASGSLSPRVSISRVPSPARSRRASGVSRRDSGRMSFGGPSAASSTAKVVPGAAAGHGAVAGAGAATTRAVDVRQQSLAMGARVPDVAAARGGPVKAVASAVASSVAGLGAGTGGAKRPAARGRDRGARETSTGGGGGGAGFGRRRDSGAVVGVAAAASDAPAAPVVAAVAPTSRLLAPTAVSQGRARPRSASPAVAAARGRASSGGFGSGPSGVAGEGRRLSSAGPPQPAGSKPKPRSQSTGRRPLTQPKTPNFRTTYRFKADKPQETTEEVEFKKQQAMQEHLKQMTRRNQTVMERSRRTAYSGNVRSSKPLTVPESPAMKTVGRLGGKVYAAVGPQADQAGFSPTHPAKDNPLLKEHEALAQEKPKGPTVPAPFQLSKSNRSDKAPGSAPGTPRTREETLTFRESLARIENKTPDRFRSRPAGDHSLPAPVAHVEPKPTLPVSPKFRTEARAAGHVKSHLPSREQREEAELADMKKHQFKARPYNPDGFGVGGEQGVFRPQHSDKTLTQPAPFRLSTDGRASKRAPSPHRSRDEEELSKQFKARPLPTGRSSSVGRVRPGANVGPGSSAELKPRAVVKPKGLTIAESPMLSTKRRSAMRSSSVGGAGQTSEQAELDEAAAKQFRARPMPNYTKMSSQSRRQSVAIGDQPVGPTETRPFHLRSEERGKAKQALLAQRLLTQRRQEEAAAKVRARPLPAPSQGFFPQPSERPLTETAEFCLSSQTRHERAAQEFRDRVRMEEERARRATQVVALPLPAATFEPELYPERTELALTQPVERVLHSSARAEGRAKWEENNQARIEAEELARVDLVKATAAAEKRAIAELRRRSHAEGGMAFKAKPIKWTATAPDCAQLSTAPLTTPITPNLRTKRRAMNAAPLEAPIA